jgi:hypothetical protein
MAWSWVIPKAVHRSAADAEDGLLEAGCWWRIGGSSKPASDPQRLDPTDYPKA